MERQPFSKLKRFMMENMLKKRGFSKGKEGLYWRLAGEGIGAVELQTSTLRAVYYVNICWTMQGLPAMTVGRDLQPGLMRQLDFVMLERMEQVSTRPSLPAMWCFTHDEQNVESTLRQSLELAMEATASIENHFADTRRFLTEIPPELLEQDLAERANERDLAERPVLARLRSILHGFYPGDSFSIPYWLMRVSERERRRDLAAKYLKRAADAAFFEHQKRMVREGAERGRKGSVLTPGNVARTAQCSE